jgi:spore germination protein
VIILAVYVVKPGDSIHAISKTFGVTAEQISVDNGLENSTQLVIGQALVINPSQRVHLVKQGNTVSSIAKQYGVTQSQIIQANPEIGANGILKVGQKVVIPAAPVHKLGTIEVNGYVFPGSNMQVVSSSLSSLTYLSIFSYEVRPDGSLSSIDDEKWINLARANKVAPIMVITNIREGGKFNSDIGHSILTNEVAQANLIKNVENNLKAKNYYGVNIDFEYLFQYDKQNYNNFIQRITNRMHDLGYKVFTALAPKLNGTQSGLLYEAHDYAFHGKTVDRVILMTYEWGYLAGPPQAVAPLDQVRKVLDYAVTVIPRDKILMGVPNYGYDWTLPYKKGTLAKTFSNVEGVNRAFKNHVNIKYDPVSQSPYYTYYDSNKVQHIVWFEDVRSIRAKLMLVNEFGLAGISIWTAEKTFPQSYIILNSMFNIVKVI